MLDCVVRLENATAGTPGGERVRESIARWTRPLRVDVAGRPGVGKSSVLIALGSVCGTVPTEVHGVDSPDVADRALDSDVLIYVVVREPHPSDLAAIALRRRADTVVVLAKADTLENRVEAAAATALATSLPAVAVDTNDAADWEALRSVAESTAKQVTAERTRTLRAELEAAATEQASLREDVERFLAGCLDRR